MAEMMPIPTMLSIGMCDGNDIVPEIGQIECAEARGDLDEDDEAGGGVRSQIEECQQRNDQQPHQERRAGAAVVVGAPQDGEDQVLDRQQGQRGVVPGDRT